MNVAAPGDAARGGGPAFGALVHVVLSQAPFDAPLDQLEALAAVEARVLGLGEAEHVGGRARRGEGAGPRHHRPRSCRGRSVGRAGARRR